MRFPTPFRKDLKALKAKRKNKYKPTATPSTTIFRKGSTCRDDFAGPTSLDHKIHELKGEDSGLLTPLAASPALKSEDSLGDFKDVSFFCCLLSSSLLFELFFFFVSWL